MGQINSKKNDIIYQKPLDVTDNENSVDNENNDEHELILKQKNKLFKLNKILQNQITDKQNQLAELNNEINEKYNEYETIKAKIKKLNADVYQKQEILSEYHYNMKRKSSSTMGKIK